MVVVAQLVELQIVDLAVAGSIPVDHPRLVRFPTAAQNSRIYCILMPRIVAKILLCTTVVTNALPIAVMIALIPLIENDVALTAVYAIFILAALMTRQDKKDLIFLIFGFVTLFFSEYLFISTGVETFERRSLLGVMPLWLPFLWAYVFIAIRRMVAGLERYMR